MAQITLLTYWKVLRERGKLLFSIMIFSAVVMTVTTLSNPRMYTAEVTVFPPTGTMSFFAGMGLPALTGSSPTSVDSLAFLIKSRRMAEGIVDHFSLDKKLQTTRNGAIHSAQRMMNSYDISKGTIFVIEATSSDPKFSADLANFCIENLNNINEQLLLTADKPLVKVIDSAEPPLAPDPRYTLKKVLGAILFSGISAYFFFFFSEYMRMLREEKKSKSITEDAERILKEL